MMRGAPIRVRAFLLGLLTVLFLFPLRASRCYAEPSFPVDASRFRSTLKPSPCFVGDVARLEVEIPPSVLGGLAEGGNVAYRPVPGSEAPVVLRSATLDRYPDGSWHLVVMFSAYALGKLPLPPVLVDGFSFRGLGAEVSSVFVDGTSSAELAPPLPPLPLPGAAPLVYGLVAAVVGAALALALAFGFGRRRLAGIILRRRYRHRIRVQRRNLARLSAGAAAGSDADWSALAHALRDLLAASLGPDFRSLTPAELLETSRGGSYPDRRNASSAASPDGRGSLGILLPVPSAESLAFAAEDLGAADRARFAPSAGTSAGGAPTGPLGSAPTTDGTSSTAGPFRSALDRALLLADELLSGPPRSPGEAGPAGPGTGASEQAVGSRAAAAPSRSGGPSSTGGTLNARDAIAGEGSSC